MNYVDGFLLPVPTAKLKAYAKMSKSASKIWMEYGALDYKECVGDDLSIKGMVQFSALIKAKKNESVVFAYIVYKSKAHRNAVNKKVMNDPRIAELCTDKNVPFNPKRMAYGGFKVFVDGAKR